MRTKGTTFVVGWALAWYAVLSFAACNPHKTGSTGQHDTDPSPSPSSLDTVCDTNAVDVWQQACTANGGTIVGTDCEAGLPDGGVSPSDDMGPAEYGNYDGGTPSVSPEAVVLSNSVLRALSLPNGIPVRTIPSTRSYDPATCSWEGRLLVLDFTRFTLSVIDAVLAVVAVCWAGSIVAVKVGQVATFQSDAQALITAINAAIAAVRSGDKNALAAAVIVIGVALKTLQADAQAIGDTAATVLDYAASWWAQIQNEYWDWKDACTKPVTCGDLYGSANSYCDNTPDHSVCGTSGLSAAGSNCGGVCCAQTCAALAQTNNWQFGVCSQQACSGPGYTTSDCACCSAPYVQTCATIGQASGWTGAFCDNTTGSSICGGVAGAVGTSDCKSCCNPTCNQLATANGWQTWIGDNGSGAACSGHGTAYRSSDWAYCCDGGPSPTPTPSPAS